MKKLFLLIPVFAILLLSSCKTFKPQAPSASYVPFVVKPQLSVLSVPLEIPENQLEQLINSYLSGVLYEDNNLNDDDMMMKVSKLNNIKLDVVGEEFRYTVPLKIWLKAGFKIEKFGLIMSDYEETNCSLNIDFVSKIKVNSDWSVSSSTSMAGYEWITKPSLDWGLINIPLTYIADKIIASQKDKLTPLIDQQTAKYLQVKQYIEPGWIKMQDPVNLSLDPESWLTIEPNEIQMSPLMGRAGVIQTSIGIKAYLYYRLGSKPAINFQPLPNLKMTKSESGYFSFSLVTDIDYAFAEKLSKQYFEGQIYEFSNGKKKIKIEGVTLYGNMGKLVIGMTLSGSLNGKVFLSGVPFYDASDKSIKVKDMDFDLDTKNKLLKSANWLAHGIFLKKMQENLVFSLEDNLREAQNMIQENISDKKINDYVTLDGRISQIIPENIFLTESGISAVVVTKGVLNVELKVK